MTTDAPAPYSVPWRASAGLAAFLGWIVPGLGHVLLGRPVKALLFFGMILGTYAFGLWLADWRCVNYERDKVWFIAQSFAAGPTALTAWLTQDLTLSRVIPRFDVGQLYVGVAALLNAIAVADAIGTAQEIQDAYALEAAARAQAASEFERARAQEASLAGHPATAAEDEWPGPPPQPDASDAPPAAPAESAPPQEPLP